MSVEVTGGQKTPKSRELVNKWSLNDFVKFTGAIERNEMADHLAVLDIAIQPGVTDYASPMKIIEYMAMGKAIIAPDKKNIRDILINQENALLFEEENKDDLYKKISLIIKDENLREKISNNAYNSIERMKLYWKENAKKAIDLLYKN